MLTSTLKPEFLDQFRGLPPSEQFGPIAACLIEMAQHTVIPALSLFTPTISTTPLLKIEPPYRLFPELRCNGDTFLIDAQVTVGDDELFGVKLFSGMHRLLIRVNETLKNNIFADTKVMKLGGKPALREELRRLESAAPSGFRYVAGEKYRGVFERERDSFEFPLSVKHHDGAVDHPGVVLAGHPDCCKIVFTSPFSVRILPDEKGVLHYFFYVKFTGCVVTGADAKAKLALYHVEENVREEA